MTESRTKQRTAPKRKRPKERRFVPSNSPAHRLALLSGHLGAALLGAGIAGLFLVDESPSYAPALLVAGIVGAVTYWRLEGSTQSPIRVGPTGIGIEQRDDIARLRWCEIERIGIKAGQLVVEGLGQQLDINLAVHAKAASSIVKEAASRVPEHLDISPGAHERLPPVSDDDGQLTDTIPLQIAGRHFEGSSETIASERDARLCARCAALYPKANPPDKCRVCQQPLKGNLLAV